jgi:hypothetical protein
VADLFASAQEGEIVPGSAQIVPLIVSVCVVLYARGALEDLVVDSVAELGWEAQGRRIALISLGAASC